MTTEFGRKEAWSSWGAGQGPGAGGRGGSSEPWLSGSLAACSSLDARREGALTGLQGRKLPDQRVEFAPDQVCTENTGISGAGSGGRRPCPALPAPRCAQADTPFRRRHWGTELTVWPREAAELDLAPPAGVPAAPRLDPYAFTASTVRH